MAAPVLRDLDDDLLRTRDHRSDRAQHARHVRRLLQQPGRRDPVQHHVQHLLHQHLRVRGHHQADRSRQVLLLQPLERLRYCRRLVLRRRSA